MRIIEPGHAYLLDNFEDRLSDGPQKLQFIHKQQPDPAQPDLQTTANGTTNEEVLRVLIDRTKWLQAQYPCRENAIAITKMEEALMWFDKRTADRVARDVEGKNIV